MGLDGLTASTLRALNVLKRIPRDHFVNNLDEAKVVERRVLGS